MTETCSGTADDQTKENRPDYGLNLTMTFRAVDVPDFARWHLLKGRLDDVKGKSPAIDWLTLLLKLPDGLCMVNDADPTNSQVQGYEINLPGIFWPTPDSLCFQFRGMLVRLQFSAWPDHIRAKVPAIQKRNIELGLMQPQFPPEIYASFYAAADAALKAAERTERARALERTLKHLDYDAQAVTVTEIADQLAITKQAVSKRIQSLIKRRWITAREPGWQSFTPDEAAIIATLPKGYKK
jgi:hypothetical protein